MTWSEPIWWMIPSGTLLLLLLHALWRTRALLHLGDKQLIPSVLRKGSNIKLWVRDILAVAALTLGVIALANPSGDAGREEVERKGLDMIFAVDLSRSMLATDVSPTRIDRAVNFIRQTVAATAGDRIGLITYAGKAYPQLPLTTDHSAVLLSLQTVHPDYMPAQGSEVQSAIDLSIEMFDLHAPQDRVLLIVSDGEDHGSGWEKSVQRAVDVGIHVFTIGFGTEIGGPIARGNDFHRDEAGEVVITRRNNAALKQMANMGKGEYFNGDLGDTPEKVMNASSAMDRVVIDTTTMTAPNDQYQFPLAMAIVLLLIRAIMTERKSDLWAKWFE